jgi:ankyrin repeat protein
VTNCTLVNINQLLTLGAKVNQPNKMGLTPLHLAVVRDCPELITLLINAGADLNSVGFGSPFHPEVTPLQYAVIICKMNSLKTLVDTGDINICTRNGDTLMHLATFYDNGHTIINFLLSRGVIHHLTKNNRGKTPLHLAVQYCKSPIIHSLIQAGSDLQTRTNTGHTPYDLYKINMETLKQMCEQSKVTFDMEYSEYLRLLTLGESVELN